MNKILKGLSVLLAGSAMVLGVGSCLRQNKNVSEVKAGEETTVDLIALSGLSATQTLNATAFEVPDTRISITGTKGTSNFPVLNYNPKTGIDLRFYKGTTCSVTFTATGASITKLEFLKNESTPSALASLSADVGTLTENVWTGESSAVKFSYNDGANNFKEQIYIINATYTVTASAVAYSYSLGDAPGVAPTGGSTTDTSITLAAAPSWDGYEFEGWSDGKNVYEAGATYTMPATGPVTFTAQWSEIRTPVSLAVTGQKVTFTQYDEFEFGGTATASYETGSPSDVTEDVVFSGYDMETAGTQTITVSYTENDVTVNDTYEITVNEFVSPYAKGNYELINSTSDLVADAHYIIMGINNDKYYGLGVYTDTTKNNVPAVEISAPNDNVISLDGTKAVADLTLVDAGNGNWAFMETSNGERYFEASGTITRASSTNYLKEISAEKYATSDKAKWSISFTENVANITSIGNVKSDKIKLNSNGTLFSCYSSGQKDVYLYKLVEKSNAASDFADEFLSSVVCDGQGNITSENWTELEIAFESLDEPSQLLFIEGTASETGSNIERALARYDYIVGKYGSAAYSDFMNRNPVAPARVSIIPNSTNSNAIWIIIAVSLVSVSALGCLIYIRKSKKL